MWGYGEQKTFPRVKPVGLLSDDLGPRKEGPTRRLTSSMSAE